VSVTDESRFSFAEWPPLSMRISTDLSSGTAARFGLPRSLMPRFIDLRRVVAICPILLGEGAGVEIVIAKGVLLA
jgi:hypothetical protein